MSSIHPALTILLADDDEEDRMMTIDALRARRVANEIRCVADGQELIDCLFRRGKYADSEEPLPGLILLDLNMPKKDGREALAEIKSDPELRRIPVVVMTTSKAEQDVLSTYNLGSNSFISKPVTLAGLIDVMEVLGQYWFQIVMLPEPEAGI